MKASVTSKEEILKTCCALAASQGLASVNMRSVAKKSGIALGTLYNYFDNKDELLLATVEQIWKDIFHTNDTLSKDLSFPEYVAYLFESIRKGAQRYPDFLFAHSMSIAGAEKEKARSMMENCFRHIREGMLMVLQNDPRVSERAFSGTFDPSEFIDFVLENMLMLLVQKEESCNMLCEIIRRTLYGAE